jgi:hypothetical protein
MDKAALTDKIRFLKRITPMVAAGFVKLLPVRRVLYLSR